MPREVTIHLPEPHAKQREILASPAKRKVIVTGRQVGKTTLAASVGTEALVAGKRFLYAAPKAKQTNTFWQAVTGRGVIDDHGGVYGYLREAIEAGLVKKNETDRTLVGQMGVTGRIEAKTAHDPDTLRGDTAIDIVWLDEYAIMDPDAWQFVVLPVLLRTDGDAYFTTTPNRKNHAYQAYVRGLQDDSGRWASFTATSYDNPHLSEAALAELAAEYGSEDSDAYRQEILAEFLENEGAVFQHIDECLYPGGDSPKDHEGHWIVAGVDWGKVNDYTACSVVCRDCARELELARFRGEEYRLQRPKLAILWHRWGVKLVVPEANSMGEPNIEELRAEGWPLEPFTMGGTTKPPLIESLVLALARERIQWLDHAIGKAELEAYERKTSPVTGHTSYSAPSGVHDDTVIARALALHAVNTGTLEMGGMYA